MAIVVRWFLAVEAAVFGSAALVHAGVLVRGYEHAAARTAESAIAFVLLVGLAASVLAPGSSRGIGLGVQGFALLGTAVGLVTIAIGVGPRTALDLTLHGVMVALLVTGLVATGRRTPVSNSRSAHAK
jgi:hypothetical protein